MSDRTERDAEEPIVKSERGKPEGDIHFSIFFIWNYYENLIVILTVI